jgi:adenosine deaminase
VTTVPTDAHVRAMPKVELHVHVEGAAPASTIADLARRNGIDLGVDDPADLYRYRDLADFLRVFDLVCRCLRTAADIHRVTYEALTIAAAAGVVHREMMFSPAFVMRHGVPFTTIWDGIAAGVADARTDRGIVGHMIMDVHKPAGARAAAELVELAATCDRQLLVGIGGDGGEAGVDLASYRPVFERARQLGFHTTMHLGEEGPAADIRTGVVELGVERIDHGVSLVDDEPLLDFVVERRIPVTVCPTSNVAIGIVGSVAEHPVGRLLDAGAVVTINSDNAEMFGVDATDELISVRDAFDLDVVAVEQLCLNGVEAAWLDDSDRRDLRTRVTTGLAALR